MPPGKATAPNPIFGEANDTLRPNGRSAASWTWKPPEGLPDIYARDGADG